MNRREQRLSQLECQAFSADKEQRQARHSSLSSGTAINRGPSSWPTVNPRPEDKQRVQILFFANCIPWLSDHRGQLTFRIRRLGGETRNYQVNVGGVNETAVTDIQPLQFILTGRRSARRLAEIVHRPA